MAGNVGDVSHNQSNGDNFTKRVEQKEQEIKKNSLFDTLEPKAGEYVEEAGFLMALYDTDNSGNFTKKELDAKSCNEFDAKRKEFDSDGSKLVLTSCEDVEAELGRQIGQNGNLPPKMLKETGFVDAISTAATSDADINYGEDYKNALTESKELETETTDTTTALGRVTAALLSSDKATINTLNRLMSPEARARIENEINEK